MKSDQSIAPQPSTVAASILTSESRAVRGMRPPHPRGRLAACARGPGSARGRQSPPTPVRRHARLREPPRDRGVPETAAGQRRGATGGEAAVVDGALGHAERRGARHRRSPRARGASRLADAEVARAERPARPGRRHVRATRAGSPAAASRPPVPTVSPTQTTTSTGSVRHSRSSRLDDDAAASRGSPSRGPRATRGATATSSVAACSASAAALGGGGRTRPAPGGASFWIDARIACVTSGCSRRNAVAFWRPWPSRSSPKLKYEPDFWTSFRSSAVSRTVPSQEIPGRR